jgi:hypothetical protein
MDVEHHGGEWRNDLLLGSSNLAATEFYQPLGATHLFVAPYAFASKLPRNEFTGQTRVAVFGDEKAGGGFDFGYNTGERSELRWGYEIFSGKLAPLIGSAGLPSVSGSTGEFRTRYVWDGQDNPSVPGRGTRIVANLSRVLQSPGLVHPIDQLDVQTSTFIPTGPRTSLFFWPRVEPRSTAPQVHSRSLRSVERSASAPIFRRNLSATTTPTPHWDSAANFTTCRSSSEERSTGGDGTRPVRPSTIPVRWWSAARSISG